LSEIIKIYNNGGKISFKKLFTNCRHIAFRREKIINNKQLLLCILRDKEGAKAGDLR
jgi:hypothetical protein